MAFARQSVKTPHIRTPILGYYVERTETEKEDERDTALNDYLALTLGRKIQLAVFFLFFPSIILLKVKVNQTPGSFSLS